MFGATILLCFTGPVVGPADWDPKALPTVTVEDVDRFHDAILAIQHNASARAIEKHIAELEGASWNMNVCRHEYDCEMKRLKWVAQCWSRLEVGYGGEGEICRTAALDELRRLLGPQMFYAGMMPEYPPGAMPWSWPKPKQ